MKYEFKDLDQQDVQLISHALAQLPIKIGFNTFMKIQTQIKEQDEKNAVPIESLGIGSEQTG